MERKWWDKNYICQKGGTNFIPEIDLKEDIKEVIMLIQDDESIKKDKDYI